MTMNNIISFFVPGIPRPGGSKTAFRNKYTGRIQVVDASKNQDWKSIVAYSARQAYSGEPLLGPVRLKIIFQMPRPKSHYGTGCNNGRLKTSAPYYHTVAPDATKLLRSTEDALKAILWKDDSQVAIQEVEKVYGAIPGAKIEVELQ